MESINVDRNVVIMIKSPKFTFVFKYVISLYLVEITIVQNFVILETAINVLSILISL